MAIGAAVAVVALLAGGYVFWKNHQQPAAPSGPDPVLVRNLPRMIDAAAGDAELQNILKEFAGNPAVVKSDAEFENAVRGWSVATDLQNKSTSFAEYGWSALATSASNAAILDPADQDLGKAIKNAEKAKDDADAIDDGWQTIRDDAEKYNAAGSPVPGMRDWASQHLAQVTTLAEAAPFVDQTQNDIDRVANYLSGPAAARLDRLQFAQVVPHPEALSPAEWLKEAHDFEPVSPLRVSSWEEKIKEDAVALSDLSDAGSLQGQLDTIHARATVALNRDETGIDQDLDAIERQIEQRRHAEASNPAQSQGSGTAPPVPTTTPPPEDPEYGKFMDALSVLRGAVERAQTLADVQAAEQAFSATLTPKYQSDPSVQALIAELASASQNAGNAHSTAGRREGVDARREGDGGLRGISHPGHPVQCSLSQGATPGRRRGVCAERDRHARRDCSQSGNAVSISR